MRQKVFSRIVQCMEDMSLLEQTIGSLLGGERNQCALVRCSEFVQLRLCALYNRGEKPMHVFGDGLQISLDENNVATVYLLSSSVDTDESILGKRAQPDIPGDETDPAECGPA